MLFGDSLITVYLRISAVSATVITLYSDPRIEQTQSVTVLRFGVHSVTLLSTNNIWVGLYLIWYLFYSNIDITP